MTHKSILLLSCLLFLILGAEAQVVQNLIKNPSFEQYEKVPADLGAVHQIDYWSNPTKSTPDYFHKRAANKSVDIPVSKMGNTFPKTGYAYTGIYAYTSRYSKRNFREYLQVEFKQSLLAGHTYCVKAHVYLAESSNRALEELGAFASPKRLKIPHETVIGLPHIRLQKSDKTPLNDRKWVEVRCDYKAKGGEKYLVIGNFKDDKASKVSGAEALPKFKNPHVDFAYYFVDDVCVTDTKTNFSCDCGSFDYFTSLREQRIVLDFKIKEKQYRLGQVVIMHGVEFVKGKTVLLASAEKPLKDLVATLRNNPNYHVELSAHTSSSGNPKKNHQLSVKRAEMVFNQLVADGVAVERLRHRGYGQSKPIALNKTSSGRAMNERVEFRIIKK